MVKGYTSISLKTSLVDKLKMVKGTKSYSMFIEETVFNKQEKVNQILKNTLMIERIIKEIDKIGKIVQRGSGGEYEFRIEDFHIEEN